MEFIASDASIILLSFLCLQFLLLLHYPLSFFYLSLSFVEELLLLQGHLGDTGFSSCLSSQKKGEEEEE